MNFEFLVRQMINAQFVNKADSNIVTHGVECDTQNGVQFLGTSVFFTNIEFAEEIALELEIVPDAESRVLLADRDEDWSVQTSVH